MDIDHRLPMTDPFARVKQRVAQAEILVQELPPAQRQTLVTAMLTSMTAPTPASIDGPVAMTSVAVCDWESGSDALPRTAVTRISRPLRIRQPPPLAWQWCVAGLRLKRWMSRQWQRQSRLLKREFRLLVRQPLYQRKHRRERR